LATVLYVVALRSVNRLVSVVIAALLLSNAHLGFPTKERCPVSSADIEPLYPIKLLVLPVFVINAYMDKLGLVICVVTVVFGYLIVCARSQRPVSGSSTQNVITP
jgi:hypothetical protein